jgi:hypothetical protein
MADRTTPSPTRMRPTVKMQMPYFYPKIVVSADGTGVEVIEHIGSPGCG